MHTDKTKDLNSVLLIRVHPCPSVANNLDGHFDPSLLRNRIHRQAGLPDG